MCISCKRSPDSQCRRNERPNIRQAHKHRKARMNSLCLCRLLRSLEQPKRITSGDDSSYEQNSCTRYPAAESSQYARGIKRQGQEQGSPAYRPQPKKNRKPFCAESPANGTGKPQVCRTRNRWSKFAGNSGELPRRARNRQAPKLINSVRSRPAEPAITTNTHSSSFVLPGSCGRWPETVRKNIRKAAT